MLDVLLVVQLSSLFVTNFQTEHHNTFHVKSARINCITFSVLNARIHSVLKTTEWAQLANVNADLRDVMLFVIAARILNAFHRIIGIRVHLGVVKSVNILLIL